MESNAELEIAELITDSRNRAMVCLAALENMNSLPFDEEWSIDGVSMDRTELLAGVQQGLGEVVAKLDDAYGLL